MHVSDQQLKAFILDSGLVDAKNFKKAESKSKKTGKNIADILLEEKLVSLDKLNKLKAYILGIPFIDLSKEKIDRSVLDYIPEPIARKYNIIAFRKNGNELEVAMNDPDDLQIIDFIRKKNNFKILPRFASLDGIKYAIAQYQKSLEAEFGDIIKVESDKVLKTSGEEAELKKMAEDLPVVSIVDTLIKHAILQNASDIHIEPMEKEVLVRYRIDGILHDAMVLPQKINEGVVARIKVLSSLKLDEHRLPQDGRFKIENKDHKFSFRVSILPVYDGEKIVMRLLPEDSKGFTLESLGFWGRDLEILHRNIKRSYGMILATGPTGCGKTTTLYTILDILNTEGVNISTIEDPVEYRMPRINQTQVKPKIGYTFANGLRALVRQDPDIIMVGEIRDNETAGLAVNAALTGHLVLSTLHTNTAAGAIPRLIDMKAEGFLLASTLNVIIAQRLVRTLHKESRQKYFLSNKEIASIKKDMDLDKILRILKDSRIVSAASDWSAIPFYKPVKSEDFPEGYKGRIGIHEILEVSDEVKGLIAKNVADNVIEEKARSEGMITMQEDGFIKAAQGITSIEEVLSATSE
ncbi:MAG: GspE/PulE family protein [Patescibacteria group bacterium]